MPGNRIVFGALCAAALLCAISGAASATGPRKPLGVYAHVDIGDAILSYPGSGTPTEAQLHLYLRSLYNNLLTNPAISGIALGAHWDQTQPSSGNSPGDFNWDYLDDAFAAAGTAGKTIQLIVTPGFDTPPWLLAQISSCDPLFTTGSAPSDCGSVSFAGFKEEQRSDGTVLPLPWNSVYQAAWGQFLTSLNARYSSNPAFVAIAIAGPAAGSDEWILPADSNDTAVQPSGLSCDDTWAALLQHSFPSNSAYQDTDQAFIDGGKQAIDQAEAIFSGVTIFLGPDAGNDFPNFANSVTPHSDNTLFAQECSAVAKSEIQSCEAKTEILSYFVTVTGPNAKGTQVGGMTASSLATPGNIGIAGVKVLTGLSPAPAIPFQGGAEFDKPVSGAGNLQSEGCPDPSGNCPGLTVEEGAYNVLTDFFYGTPVAANYGGAVGTAPIQYLDVDFNDVQYAFANLCPAISSPTLGETSLLDLFNRASHDLFAMANQASALPAPTCSSHTGASPLTISLSNTQLEFWNYVAQNSLTPAQTVGISNAGPWFAYANVPWINLTQSAAGVTISVNPAGLAPASYPAVVTIDSPDATNNPQTISVTLNVIPSLSSPPPVSTRFVPITPCRIADTRNANGLFGGPSMPGQTARDFPIPSSACAIPANATAYSLNVAVVPAGTLGYLTLWPTGQPQPQVATLNSDGRIKSNAAIIPAGLNGAISMFATDTTDIVLDINGYFVPSTNTSALAFYPVTPCRIADTRNATGPLGGPSLTTNGTRTFPILSSSCAIPATAQAYSLNFAAVPKGPLGYLTAWPTGRSQPTVASLNAPTGTVVANAVIVPSGTGGSIDVFSTNATDLVIDIDGYFAPGASGGLSLYTAAPCRVLDSRLPAGTPPFSTTKNISVTGSACGVPAAAMAYVFNATVVPPGPLGYITMWPQGEPQPVVATLNALDGAITSNLAIVPANDGSISVFPYNPTYLVLDLFGYFAP